MCDEINAVSEKLISFLQVLDSELHVRGITGKLKLTEVRRRQYIH